MSKTIKIHFILPNGTKHTVDAPVGLSLLEITRKHQNAIYLEGACDGALACSTCHLIVDEQFFDMIPPATDEEDDMLDLAFGLTKTSRLGCQIILTEKMDGMSVSIPKESRNIMLS